MPESEISQNDQIPNIVKFHSYVLHTMTKPDPELTKFVMKNGKRTKVFGDVRLRAHNITRFNQSICQIMMDKQRRIFKCWIQYVEMIKYFKFKVHMNFKSRIF